jgi:hypothetical protein
MAICTFNACGAVDLMTRTNGVNCYTKGPTLVFTPTYGGSGASATAVLGGVGSGCNATVIVGSGVSATATMNGSSATSTAASCVINSKKNAFWFQ